MWERVPRRRPTPEPGVALSRAVGWKGAGAPNRGSRRVEAGEHAVDRIPIDGIKGTGMPTRAIVVLPSPLPEAPSLDVLLHLHGFTPGYATGDDLGVYNIEAQMAAAGGDLMAILPQGSATSDFNAGAPGKAFDADDFIAAVFARLAQEGLDVPKPGRVILSSHSGGDQSIAEMLKSGQGAAGKAPGKLAGMFLFDTMIASSFGGAVGQFVDERIKTELDHLRLMRFAPGDPAAIEAAMIAWIRENGFRLQVVYRKGGAYEAAARDIDFKLALRFASSIKELGAPGAPVYEAMRANFAVREVADLARIGHMDVLKGDDALRQAIETLGPHVGNQAIARMLARDTAPPVAAETVTVTVRWDTTDPPQTYLEDAFTDHPVDWKADVLVDNKKVGSGDGSLEVKLVKGSKHDIKVVPTAAAPNDYYEPAIKKSYTVGDAATVDIKLAYNRENRYFTDASWEHVGIDATKAGKVVGDTLLGQKVTVNKLVQPTVKKTNDYFDSAALSDEDRAAVKATLVHIGGYNRRTTSTGAFSNHSTGCAVDINTNMATAQNDHWKKGEPAMKKRMELFAHVVGRESGWASFDGWSEKDSKKWLEASRLFNFHFPRFLSELLDDAAGVTTNTDLAKLGEALDWFGGTAAVGAAMVTSQDATKLKAAAKTAKKAGKADTAKWLERTADDWKVVRAWIEGVVMYDTEHWAYVSEHEKNVAAGKEKRTPIGELHGAIPLHPKLVETLEAGGWSWLIDEQHAKDFMHFEDRAAFTALKR